MPGVMCKTLVAQAIACIGLTWSTGGLSADAATGRAAGSVDAPPVDVVSTTPLPWIGVARELLPFPVHSISAQAVSEAQSTNLAEFMGARLPGVNVNEIQGNPYQSDLNYRGFSASPLLGTAQGLSLYVDGVRANEAFGDIVNWDLIPLNAMAGAELMPGSNPAFGLNTLGGALSLRTKDGFAHPGGSVEAEAGSFGRKALGAEYGASQGRWGTYFAVHAADEDGWRDFSPSEIRQALGKVSLRDGERDLDVTLSHADNDLTGNGLVPQSMFAARKEQVFTVPDNTRHQFSQLVVNGGLWLDKDWRLEANAYARRSDAQTLNGDANDDFEENPALDGAEGANGGLGVAQETAVNNRTATRQRSHGAALQLTRLGATSQLTVGASYDNGRSRFRQTAEVGTFDAARRAVGDGVVELENELTGRTRTGSVYLSSTAALTKEVSLHASGRFNDTRVTTRDQINFVAPNLDGDHRYRKFNPAVGATWQFAPTTTLYGGFNQGNRAPTPLELGCADPANPCTLPNALAADPFLKQVVTRTLEAGVRGSTATGTRWRAGAFRSVNHDDILFVGTSTSAGYFTNFGRTRRTGAELEFSGRQGRLSWDASVNWVRAEFASSACILAENNSTRGQDAACTGGGQNDEILVSSGNRIPGIPERSLKLAAGWQLTDRWQLGAEVAAFAKQYVRGNENNRHQAGDSTDSFGDTRTFQGAGTAPGYAVVNLRTRFQMRQGWEVFARVNNVFDKRYFTGGALAENPFAADGSFQTNSDNWTRETFYAPGAPRAGWIGVNYRFGGPATGGKSAAEG